MKTSAMIELNLLLCELFLSVRWFKDAQTKKIGSIGTKAKTSESFEYLGSMINDVAGALSKTSTT